MLGDSPGAAPSDRAGHQVAPATHGGWPYDQHTGAGGRPVVAYLHAASGRRYPLNAVATRIGRLSDNDIALDDADVSPHHAVIIDTGTNYSIKTGTNYIINDLRSANGVHVQYQRIRSTATLNDGDHIRIGDQEFTFHIATEA
jgi:pSer/pThr/pTyr-binding forkhead associated (FHA) protein